MIDSDSIIEFGIKTLASIVGSVTEPLVP